jgi:hypothetical protein
MGAVRYLVAAVVLVGLLAGCSATTSHPEPASPAPARPAPAPAPPTCAWYTALAPPGQVVNVVATGPACRDRSLIDWLTSDSDRPWTTESVIPGSFGTLLAGFTKGRSTVQVWFTGPPVVTISPAAPTPSLSAPPAATLAGRLANALMASGWQPNPNN